MFDYIGEKIRAGVLSSLPWISRAAGYTEPARAVDSGRFYPGARPYAGQPCTDAGDVLNMAPEEGDTAIAFVDSDFEIRVIGENRRWQEVETFFRVVVWYDTRKVAIDAGHLATGLQMAINAGVGALDFNTEGLQGAKARFYTFTDTPSRIWARYGMADDPGGVFMLPYRTFALTYKFTARYRAECFTGEITADANAC